MRPLRRNRQTDDQETPELRRVTLPRRPSFHVAWDALLTILAVLLAGTAWLLSNFDLLPAEVPSLFPAFGAGFSLLWALISLIRRNPHTIIYSTALLGAAISLLLSAQGIAPIGTTLVGLTLISLGAGLILRGLLMPNQPI